MDCEIIVIGAGASGLTAAHALLQLGHDVCVIEARHRVGGRIMTVNGPDQPVELGAEFVHGAPPEIMDVAKHCQLEVSSVSNGELSFQNGELLKSDRWESIETGLKKISSQAQVGAAVGSLLSNPSSSLTNTELLATRNFIENFHAADLDLMGQAELAEAEQESANEVKQAHRFVNGYSQLIESYFRRCPELRQRVRLGRRVREIQWQKNRCDVMVEVAGQIENYRAEKVVVSVPIGVLKAGAIRFLPSLPQKQKCLADIHMGCALRIVFDFDKTVWSPALSDTFVHHFDAKAFPVWWTRGVSSQATGWVGGPKALSLSFLSPEQTFALALQDFAKLCQLNDTKPLLRSLKNWHYHNWQTDPFSLGSYSYLGQNGLQARKTFAEPVQGTLYFAGEGAVQDSSRGTVQAAMIAAQHVAHQIAQDGVKIAEQS